MQLSRILTNTIFVKAKRGAAKLISNRFRMASLMAAVGKKLYTIENKKKFGADLKDKIFELGRLLKASVTGRYRNLPWKSALSIAAALIYFVNPADVIPDIIPFSGLLDDFTILVWTYNSLQVDLEEFKKWDQHNAEPQ